MRRRLVFGAAAVLLAVACPGCARNTAAAAASAAASPAPSGVSSPEADRAEIYIQVLRRYLGTPGESSFPGTTFATATSSTGRTRPQRTRWASRKAVPRSIRTLSGGSRRR